MPPRKPLAVCVIVALLAAAITLLVIFVFREEGKTKVVDKVTDVTKSSPQKKVGQSNILYFLAALGPPNLALKREILHQNLSILRAQPSVSTLDVVLNTYGSLDDLSWLEADVRAAAPGCRIYHHHQEKAVLVQLWKGNNPHMETLRSAADRYDHVVFVLDDVRIDHLDVGAFAQIYKSLELDILSPVVHGSTNSMGVFKFDHDSRSGSDGEKNKTVTMARYTNVCEFFLYFCSHGAFFRLMDKYDCENPWMWGYDLLLGFWQFRTAVVTSGSVIHTLRDSCGDNQRKNESMFKFLLKHGFESTKNVLHQFPPQSPSFSLDEYKFGC